MRSFYPESRFFSGDRDLLEQLQSTPRDRLYHEVKDLPFPLLAPIERPQLVRENYMNRLREDPLLPEIDPERYSPEAINRVIEQQEEIVANQARILTLSQDKYNPAWYCYLHRCEIQAFYLTSTLCSLLWPEENFWLVGSSSHWIVTNHPLEKFQEHYQKQENFDTPFTSTYSSDNLLIFDPISQCIYLEEKKINMEWIFASSFIRFLLIVALDQCDIVHKRLYGW